MLYCMIAIIMLAADVLSKIFVLKNLKPIGSVTLIKNVLNFTYVENRGIAFGMFSGKVALFTAITVLVLIAVLILTVKTPKHKKSRFWKLGIAFVVSGALGNLIDRITRGFVVDFIDLGFMNFPVFNVADIAVCVGAGLLLIHFVFFDDNDKISSKEERNE